MGTTTAEREHKCAATFERRSKLRNQQAIANLGRFAAKMGLFEHGNNHADDWDAYTSRVQAERLADDTSAIAHESAETGITPKNILRNRRQDYLNKLVDETPTLKLVPSPDPISLTDPNSVDYRDPTDFFRTPLIKAAIDNDTQRVLDLVQQGASLHVRDVEGNDAMNNAYNFGSDETYDLLKRLTAEQPVKALTLRSA